MIEANIYVKDGKLALDIKPHTDEDKTTITNALKSVGVHPDEWKGTGSKARLVVDLDIKL
jgi:hypothetical protein